MINPIKPSEVAEYKKTLIPDFVVQAFNDLIASTYNGRNSSFTEEEVINKMFSYYKKQTPAPTKDLSRKEIFDNNWLDIESLYEKELWNVSYKKDGKGSYIFTAKTI